MSVQILGCKVRVSPLFFALICLLLLIDRTGSMPFVLCAIAVHESGHLIVLCRYGIKPTEIALRPFEINIQKPALCGSEREELWVSSAGIIANLLCTAASVIIWLVHPFLWALQLGICNLVLGGFEALPIAGLDGYRTLLCMSCLRYGDRSHIGLIILSYVTLGLMVFIGILVLWKINNPLPLLFCLYMGLLIPHHEEK